MHRQFSLASSRLRKKLPVPRFKEAIWLRQLRAGEPGAWLQLMDHWHSRLYNYAIHNGVSEAECQTLLCAIFAEVAQVVIGGLHVANVTVLIFSIAYQHILNHWHQSVIRPLEKQKPPPSSTGFTDDQQLAFLHALRQFTPEVQQVLLLYYLYDVSLPEIAQIVGQPEDVLTKVLYRAKHYLT